MAGGADSAYPAVLSNHRGAVRTALALGLVATLAIARAHAEAPDPLFDDDDTTDVATGFPDPIEPVNRVTFAFNQGVDRWVIDPVTRVYRFFVPPPGRRAIKRALVNLDSPVTFVNDMLQLEPVDALVTMSRFVINTTVGVAGLFDVAESLHLEGHQSDFGQTLALSGVPSGPYLILPVLGPTTARDGTGSLVDFLFRPTTYLLTPGGAVFVTTFTQQAPELLLGTLVRGSTEIASGFATRDAVGEGLAALEASSVDYYAALRNAYYQNRQALIWRRGPDHGPLAVARDALGSLSLGAPRGEVGDLAAHGGKQPLEPVALEH